MRNVSLKKSLTYRREISSEEGMKFAQDNDLLFLETSAKTGDNVEEVEYIHIIYIFF